MSHKYLIIDGLVVMFKRTLAKEEFVTYVNNYATVIDLEEKTVYDRDENKWKEADYISE